MREYYDLRRCRIVAACAELYGIAKKDRIEIVYQLLGHGLVSPEKFVSNNLMYPLALAFQAGHLEMAKLLWQFGVLAKPDLDTQMPPLQAAIRGRQVEVIRWLLPSM